MGPEGQRAGTVGRISPEGTSGEGWEGGSAGDGWEGEKRQTRAEWACRDG